jgi:hypothetical protein
MLKRNVDSGAAEDDPPRLVLERDGETADIARCRHSRRRRSYRGARKPHPEQNDERFAGFTATTSSVAVNLKERMRVCFKPSSSRSRVVTRMDVLGEDWSRRKPKPALASVRTQPPRRASRLSLFRLGFHVHSLDYVEGFRSSETRAQSSSVRSSQSLIPFTSECSAPMSFRSCDCRSRCCSSMRHRPSDLEVSRAFREHLPRPPRR